MKFLKQLYYYITTTKHERWRENPCVNDIFYVRGKLSYRNRIRLYVKEVVRDDYENKVIALWGTSASHPANKVPRRYLIQDCYLESKYEAPKS